MLIEHYAIIFLFLCVVVLWVRDNRVVGIADDLCQIRLKSVEEVERIHFKALSDAYEVQRKINEQYAKELDQHAKELDTFLEFIKTVSEKRGR